MRGGGILREHAEQPQGLIRVLLDRKAEQGARDDAATDLSAFDEPEAEAALVGVASDPTTDPDLAETCGASIAEIWCRKGGRLEPEYHSVISKLSDTSITRRSGSVPDRSAARTYASL